MSNAKKCIISLHGVFLIFLCGTRLMGVGALPITENTGYTEPNTADLEHFSTTSKRVSELYEPGHTLVNSKLCGANNGANLSLAIMVRSAPMNRERRVAIRQTWGQYAVPRSNISLGFLIGTANNQAVEDSLKVESAQYGDIIRARFKEDYSNLTLKVISQLEWIDSHCSRAPFTFFVDDDMFINIVQLKSLIDVYRRGPEKQKIIIGHVLKMAPIRKKTLKLKNTLSTDEYALSNLPVFTAGGGYVISRLAIHDLYAKALKLPYLKLEDVFITGVVAQLMNVKRIHGFDHYNLALNENIAFDTPSSICKLRKIISIHGIKPKKQLELWKKLKDVSNKC